MLEGGTQKIQYRHEEHIQNADKELERQRQTEK